MAIRRLERLLNDFAEKKETCFDYKKQNFSKSKKSAFPKGLTHAFGQKMPFLYIYKKRIFQSRKKCLIQPFDQKSQILLYLDLFITRLEKLLSHFAEKKKPVLTIKNRIFQSPKNPLF